MDRAKYELKKKNHRGIQKQTGSILFKLVLHLTWTKASVLSLQNCLPGCKWIQMSNLELELVTKML